jgi:hypothetical protein
VDQRDGRQVVTERLGTSPRRVPCAHCNGEGTIELAAEVETVEAFYFGCWKETGHYWRNQNPHTSCRQIEKLVPGMIFRYIDGGFCPGAIRGKTDRTRPEVEGQAALHHIEGWTVLAFWDRSVDSRHSSNSAFVVVGRHDYTTMLEVAKRQFPDVLRRQKVPMVLVEGPGRMGA